VQRCKSAFGLCKGGKVGSEYRVRITEYGGDNKGDWLAGVWSIGEAEEDYGGMVGTWQDRVQSAESSTEYGGKAGTWQDRVQSTEYRARLKPAKLIRGSDVTGRTDATQSRPYPRQFETGDRGPGCWHAARVVSELSIRQTLSAIRLRQHAVPALPEAGGRTSIGERTRRSRAPTRGS
jgi:hypothetical protein